MAEEAYQERTEKATPKRRQEAREKGQVAKSRDLTAAVVLLAGLAGLGLWGGRLCGGLMDLLRESLYQLRPGAAGPEQIPVLFKGLGLAAAWVLAPLLLTLFLAAGLSNYLQVGKVLSAVPITPDLSRLQLVKGFKRLFSVNSLVELGKSLAKVALVGVVAYYALKRELTELLPVFHQEPGQMLGYAGAAALRVAGPIILALLALGALDYLYQRYQYEKNLRMSKQEVKDEFRQSEGDPKVKARIKSIMRQMATKRMIAEVPKADVVLTNPTRLAVALKYDSATMAAPQVVAKGRGYIAQKILTLAREAGVPILEHRELTQALFRLVEVGEIIPVSLYRAVAEVLAFIYRLRAGVGGRL